MLWCSRRPRALMQHVVAQLLDEGMPRVDTYCAARSPQLLATRCRRGRHQHSSEKECGRMIGEETVLAEDFRGVCTIVPGRPVYTRGSGCRMQLAARRGLRCAARVRSFVCPTDSPAKQSLPTRRVSVLMKNDCLTQHSVARKQAEGRRRRRRSQQLQRTRRDQHGESTALGAPQPTPCCIGTRNGQ